MQHFLQVIKAVSPVVNIKTIMTDDGKKGNTLAQLEMSSLGIVEYFKMLSFAVNCYFVGYC